MFGKTCADIPNVCNRSYGRMVCKRHCHGCSENFFLFIRPEAKSCANCMILVILNHDIYSSKSVFHKINNVATYTVNQSNPAHPTKFVQHIISPERNNKVVFFCFCHMNGVLCEVFQVI